MGHPFIPLQVAAEYGPERLGTLASPAAVVWRRGGRVSGLEGRHLSYFDAAIPRACSVNSTIHHYHLPLTYYVLRDSDGSMRQAHDVDPASSLDWRQRSSTLRWAGGGRRLLLRNSKVRRRPQSSNSAPSSPACLPDPPLTSPSPRLTGAASHAAAGASRGRSMVMVDTAAAALATTVPERVRGSRGLPRELRRSPCTPHTHAFTRARATITPHLSHSHYRLAHPATRTCLPHPSRSLSRPRRRRNGLGKASAARRPGCRPHPPAALRSAVIGADGGEAAADGGGTTAHVGATAAAAVATVADVVGARRDRLRTVRRAPVPCAHPARPASQIAGIPSQHRSRRRPAAPASSPAHP